MNVFANNWFECGSFSLNLNRTTALAVFSLLLLVLLLNCNWWFIVHRIKRLRYNLIQIILHRTSENESKQLDSDHHNNNNTMKRGHLLLSPSIYELSYPPGPLCLPVIGHLHLLAAYGQNDAWKGFDWIRSQYGNVVWLQLGQYPTVLVSSVPAIREVLLTKGEHFANRPDFTRHALYFSMDRQNALALCDWSDLHKQRRSIAHAAVIPRFGTKCFQRLSCSVSESLENLFNQIEQMKVNADQEILLDKHYITELCCRVFFHFLLEQSVNDKSLDFSNIAQGFDLVFYDINQMYLSDFLPFLQYLSPVRQHYEFLFEKSNWIFHQVEKVVKRRFEQLIEQKKTNQRNAECEPDEPEPMKETCPSVINSIFDERFVDEILLNKQYNNSARFLDFIIEHYLQNEETMSWNEMMYEIGDLIGGHSAVANLLFRLLGHLALNQQIQMDIYQQVKLVAETKHCQTQENDPHHHWLQLTIEDQHRMPLVSASIMETLRLALSPIVPHLSRCDTCLQGYFIPKGTMVLFNIYHLNLSDEYYGNPFKFDPKRFITPEGQMIKPEHFFPFSHGRRSCLGYKMVNTIISASLSNLLLHYRVDVASNEHQSIETFLKPKGSLALPYNSNECFRVALTVRDQQNSLQ